jgi:hypothetical protein
MTNVTIYNEKEPDTMAVAELVSNGNMFPAWKGKKEDAALAIMFGKSLGLSWGHSLLNIAVINGRPSIWGDAMMALVRRSPLCEYIHETMDKKTMTAICRIKRKGEKEEVRTFSQEDAEKASLWKKTGPWQSYPARMLQLRARAFALRDVFPDILQGIGCAEEIQDYQNADMREAEYDDEVIIETSSYEVPVKGDEVVIATSSKERKSEQTSFEKRREGAFKGFETLGIDSVTVFDFYGKSGVEDFTPEDVEEIIGIGKKITSGELSAEDAFKKKHTKTDEMNEEILARK